MNKYVVLALTNPIEGQDAGFNQWYDSVAVPTYKSLPGLVPLGRFKACDVPHLHPFEMENEFQYLSMYYFEAEDPTLFFEDLKAAFAHRPEYHFSDTVDQNRFFEPVFVSLGEVNFEPIDRYGHLKR